MRCLSGASAAPTSSSARFASNGISAGGNLRASSSRGPQKRRRHGWALRKCNLSGGRPHAPPQEGRTSVAALTPRMLARQETAQVRAIARGSRLCSTGTGGAPRTVASQRKRAHCTAGARLSCGTVHEAAPGCTYDQAGRCARVQPLGGLGCRAAVGGAFQFPKPAGGTTHALPKRAPSSSGLIKTPP